MECESHGCAAVPPRGVPSPALALGLTLLAGLAVLSTQNTAQAVADIAAAEQTGQQWSQVFLRISVEYEHLVDFVRAEDAVGRVPLIFSIGSAEENLRWLNAHGGPSDVLQAQMLQNTYGGYSYTLRDLVDADERHDRRQVLMDAEQAALSASALRKQAAANVARESLAIGVLLRRTQDRSRGLQLAVVAISGLDLALVLFCALQRGGRRTHARAPLGARRTAPRRRGRRTRTALPAQGARRDAGTARRRSPGALAAPDPRPAGHNFPLACPGILGTLTVGGKVVMARSAAPDRVFPLMAAESVTVTAAVPSIAQRWIDAVASGAHPAPATLRLLQVGGARLAPEVARRVEPVLGATLQQVFGMAEGLLNYTRLDDPAPVKVETQGRPMSADDEFRIVDEADRPVPAGEMGTLLTRGPYTPRGYFRAAGHNARAFTADGWYRTGDIVRLHPTGNLVVEGRDKDLINRGGEKISAEEVENLLYRVDGVARAAVVAAPDPILGEQVCAVIVTDASTPPTLEDLRTAMAGMEVAKFKLPERLLVVDDLPQTKIGKIDKKALRELVANPAQFG